MFGGIFAIGVAIPVHIGFVVLALNRSPMICVDSGNVDFYSFCWPILRWHARIPVGSIAGIRYLDVPEVKDHLLVDVLDDVQQSLVENRVWRSVSGNTFSFDMNNAEIGSVCACRLIREYFEEV